MAQARTGTVTLVLGGLAACILGYPFLAFVPPANSQRGWEGHPSVRAGQETGSSWSCPSSTSALAALLVVGAVTRGRRTRVLSSQGSTAVEEVEESLSASGGAAVVRPAEPQAQRAWRRMWTAADFAHLHAVSGVVHTLLGAAYLVDAVVGDVVKLGGGSWQAHIPIELVLASMVFGAANALTGLQPALLPRPFKDLLQLMGFGEEGNLKSAGFVNTAIFYFILTYQSLRVLPAYPSFLQGFDPLFAAVSLLALWHAIYIINAWVDRGKLSRTFAIAMSAPLCLNLPVSAHLLLEGQTWVQQLSAAYPGWPEVFFLANYALAWAGSMVTFVLSLYERKVISLDERLIIILLIGALCFAVIPLHALLFVPQWFQGQWFVMLTLIPPS